MIIDGRTIARELEKSVKRKVESLEIKPKLAIILIGDDSASKIYVNLKVKKANELGINTELIVKREEARKSGIIEIINNLNKDKSVSGIIVQLPLPMGLCGNVCKTWSCKGCQGATEEILNSIAFEKDVDGLREGSLFLPATVRAILTILNEVSGGRGQGLDKTFTIVGQGRLVGKPLYEFLKSKSLKVIKCDQNTGSKEVRLKAREADILVSATGVPGIITADMVKPGAIVIDCGSPKAEVDFENVSKIAGWITPVPGGVGPLTVISLLENLIEAVKITR